MVAMHGTDLMWMYGCGSQVCKAIRTVTAAVWTFGGEPDDAAPSEQTGSGREGTANMIFLRNNSEFDCLRLQMPLDTDRGC